MHPPTTDTASIPFLSLQQSSLLCLLVPVPEADGDGIASGANVQVRVSALPGQQYWYCLATQILSLLNSTVVTDVVPLVSATIYQIFTSSG